MPSLHKKPNTKKLATPQTAAKARQKLDQEIMHLATVRTEQRPGHSQSKPQSKPSVAHSPGPQPLACWEPVPAQDDQLRATLLKRLSRYLGAEHANKVVSEVFNRPNPSGLKLGVSALSAAVDLHDALQSAWSVTPSQHAELHRHLSQDVLAKVQGQTRTSLKLTKPLIICLVRLFHAIMTTYADGRGGSGLPSSPRTRATKRRTTRKPSQHGRTI